MFQDNMLLQFCSVVTLIGMIILFVVSLIPEFDFDKECDHPNVVRCVFLFIILGLLRGSF